MKNSEKAILDTGILPVINIPKTDIAVPLANAIKDGGISAMEVTLRSDCSLNVIKEIKNHCKEMYIGAGTVLSIEDVDNALEAGADFIVSPGCDKKIIDYCIGKAVPIYPGCSSPTEIQMCVSKGLKAIKFFPSELSGGNVAIKLISGPFPNVKFIPTGGITFSNLSEYMQNDKVLACGGSFMAPSDLVKNREFDKITELCRRAVKISLGFELAHVGINNDSEDEATKSADKMAKIFGFGTEKFEKSVFVDKYCEFMHLKYYGKNGHIGFYTNSVMRAVAWFEKNGIEVNYETLKKKNDGAYEFVYLKEEISGFAIHVVKR